MNEERPRYIVVSVSGYSFAQGSRPRASYSVLDTAHAYREVACFYAGDRFLPRGDEARMRAAHAECARLNALDRLG